MNFFLSSASRVLTMLLLGAGLLAMSGPKATAQDTPPSLIQHLRSDLQSNDPMQRESALVDIIALASCTSSCTVNFRSINEKKLTIANETGTGHVVELNALVPDLLEAYRSGPADGHRLLALSALVNIGNEKALERLIDEGARQSKAMNKATHRSLAAFYLEKYPELIERTMKTHRLSVDDVHRAKALRVRQMKKSGEG
jgi:hypothetical protein